MTLSRIRKTFQLIVIGLVMCLVATAAWSKGTAGVKNTIHNLSTSAPIDPFLGIAPYGSNEDEICIFCHTPHGGSLTGPLWNHDLPGASSFTHYNSVTLSSYMQGLSASRDVNDESLLCMACHDGSIAVDHLINFANDNPNITFPGGFTPDNLTIIDLFGKPGPRIGGYNDTGLSGSTGRLDDDHPISFSYSAVLASADYGVGGSKENELRPIGDVGDANSVLGYQGEGVRLFGTDNRVECSSCHDPHVDYVTNTAYTPFLIRPNSGSNLCLACHNK